MEPQPGDYTRQRDAQKALDILKGQCFNAVMPGMAAQILEDNETIFAGTVGEDVVRARYHAALEHVRILLEEAKKAKYLDW
jgi:hypothetical protein